MLTNELMIKIFPHMSASQTKAFVDHQNVMDEILVSDNRTACCFANVYVETSGFARIPLENIHYTAEGMAKIWPNRFANADAVRAKYGTGPNWQHAAFNDIYGARMGNRPGTDDGSKFIGRGGPQITGRNGYEEIGKRIGVDLVNNPSAALSVDLQPAIIAAFWNWKNLSQYSNNLTMARKLWNGGSNGLSVVESQYPRILAILKSYVPATAATNVKPQTSAKDPVLLQVQTDLISLGYHEIGEADGFIGGKTLGVIKAFFTDRGIAERSGYPSQTLVDQLAAAKQDVDATGKPWHRQIAPSRAFATQTELAPKIESVQHTQSAGFFAKIGAWFGGVTATTKAAVSFMPDASDQASPYISIVQQFWNDIPGWVFPSIIAAIAIAIAVKTAQANKSTVADYQSGKIN